ncbi:ATP-dependent Clp protease adaptor ClpS [Cellvibrio mixtus]|uniref:ATP-dependent Clp protease adaptor ClpS n=1 Tax=Cellvibrio mixtus TaxID=39650 RepID=UPI000587E0E6|nr:ATP-dependent Clp protease adaptor ClpS [Cellvibrio mixtus]
MKNISTWLHDKFLSATDYGIARFPTALEFKIQHGAQEAEYALYFLDNDLTPMHYVVELLCIKFHMRRDQAAVLMMEIHENGSAEVMRNSLDVLEEVAEHLRQEAIRLDYMLECEISKLWIDV